MGNHPGLPGPGPKHPQAAGQCTATHQGRVSHPRADRSLYWSALNLPMHFKLVALGLFMLVLMLGVSCVRPPPWGEASGLGHPKHWNQTG